jgi:predicted nucleotidyltransferase
LVKTKTELTKIAEAYVKKLREYRVHVEKVILFGSYARGTQQENSDIDLAFVSEDFDHMNILERQKLLSRCREGLIPTDVLAYSPAMLEKKKHNSPVVDSILQEGISLYSHPR